MVRDVVILGSGCAGSTAAIYTGRARLSPLVLEGGEPGGQLTLTSDVENFPGFPDGISGYALVDTMKKQAIKFGAEYVSKSAVSVDLSSRPFRISTDDGTIEARCIIVATGATARRLGLRSETALFGRGVSSCATCDGAFYRDQDVVVVGGGDTAFEDALFLTRFASSVTLIHRRDGFRASKILVDRATAHPKISFLLDSVVTEVETPEKGTVTGVRVRNVKTGAESLLPADGLFIAIGHDPNTGFLAGQLELNPEGYIVVRDGAKTSVEGVFAAGDVHDPVFRQAITAAGAGCRAAIEAERFLECEGR